MASLDFGPANGAQHSLYGQPELNPSYSLHGSDNVGVYGPSSDVGADTKPSIYRQPEHLDNSEHSNYELFPGNANGGSFASQRYRTNASSSSSLTPSYGMNSDGLYSQGTFGDSVPPFGSSNGNPYDMISSMPSSYSSGKVSPLTPSDPVGGLHHGQFPPSINTKDYAPSGYPDMGDRRLPMTSPTEYHPEYSEDYMNGMNNGLAFPQNMQHFPERLNRFPDRYGAQAAGNPPHMGGAQQQDMVRAIPPHATHSYRDGNGYEDMHYMNPNPHSDMSMRMSVDETLARMKLHNPAIGTSTDLQSFIR